jgi:hypothetical protein
MDTTSPIEYRGTESRICACGCDQPYTVSQGTLRYGEEREVLFKLALVQHAENDRHVWVALISGPWTDDDAGDCWVFIHGWPKEDGVTARVEDMAESPWSAEDLDGARPIPREEVMSNAPAKSWVFECFNDLIQHHNDVAPFIFATHGRTQ